MPTVPIPRGGETPWREMSFLVIFRLLRSLLLMPGEKMGKVDVHLCETSQTDDSISFPREFLAKKGGLENGMES